MTDLDPNSAAARLFLASLRIDAPEATLADCHGILLGDAEINARWRSVAAECERVCQERVAAALGEKKATHVLVPREPIEAMVSAGWAEAGDDPHAVWRAMLTAAEADPEVSRG